jgi:hypothetical protein
MITLDGIKFAGASRFPTGDQGEYTADHLRLAGVLDVPNDPARTKEQIANDLVTQILLAGRKYYILAGCLAEDGEVWSRAEADANAARFAEITDASEKATMQSYLVEFVIRFFTGG